MRAKVFSMPVPAPGPQLPRMQATPSSSHLAALGHDRASQVMAAEFRDGSLYAYASVPEGTYQRIISAKSIGQAFHAMVSGRFKSIKIKPPTPKSPPAQNQ